MPLSIILDHGTQFTSKFWGILHEHLSIQLTFSTPFYPKTEGQSKRTIKMLKDMLRLFLIDSRGHWNKFLPFLEFSYNNSYHFSIDMQLYKVHDGRGCTSHIGLLDAGDVKPSRLIW